VNTNKQIYLTLANEPAIVGELAIALSKGDELERLNIYLFILLFV
jgi:hypothetical protein